MNTKNKDEPRYCSCHNVSMVKYKNIRYKTGSSAQTHYYRCRVKLNAWQNKRTAKQSSDVKYKLYRDARLKKFGINEDEYKTMFNKQNGLCAICYSSPDGRWKMLAVDHDHNTGEVRGLLCMVCNTMLGRLENRLEKTLNYLGIKYEN